MGEAAYGLTVFQQLRKTLISLTEMARQEQQSRTFWAKEMVVMYPKVIGDQ